MKYRVEMTGESFEVETVTANHARVDGVDFNLDMMAGHLLHNGRSVRFRVHRDANGAPWAVSLQGRLIPLTVVDLARTRHMQAGRRPQAPVDGQIVAPMNGQVVKVLRRAGDTVEKEDVVLVLEAMKMENEVTAAVAGQIRAVHVAQGATVKPGDELFTIEPIASPMA